MCCCGKVEKLIDYKCSETPLGRFHCLVKFPVIPLSQFVRRIQEHSHFLISKKLCT